MATNANPLGIFSTALATMPKPFNLSKELSDYQLAQSEAARNNASIPGIQAATQGQQLENQRQKQALEADQAVRDILKQHTQNVPVTPPGAHLPPPPMGSDGQPQMSPEYQAAQVNSAAQVPDLDVGSAALALTKAGYGDRAITLLKTDQELKKQRQELTKNDLANFEAQRGAREDVLSGVVEAMYPDGMDKPRSDAGVQKAAQLWASMSAEEKQRAGIPEGVPFDPGMVEAKYRQAAGASGVTKQIAAHLGLKESAAKTAEAEARTKESTAQAGLVTEQTKQFELSNKAAEEFIKNPSSVLGAGGLIERLGLDPATTNRLKNQIYGLWQMPGTPKEKQQAVNSAIQKATDQANELQKQVSEKTNSTIMDAEVTLTRRKAQAEADAFSLAPDAVQMAAQQYRSTGQMPSIARNRAAQKQIMDAAAAMGPIDLASNQAAFKANEASLNGLQKNLDSVTAFENTAKKNLDLFLNQAKKVVDTGSPLLNGPARAAAKALAGSADQASYEAARQVAINEIAKVTGNPGLSGQLSDSARHEVESFNPNSATLAQTIAVANTLKSDMENRRTSYQEQIADIKKRIGAGGGGGTPATSAAPAPAFKTGDTRVINGVTYKRDGSGQWHAQ